MNKLPTSSSQDKLIIIQDAAKFLKVSTKTLRRWDAGGILVPQRTSGNQRRYSLLQLQEFKKNKKALKSQLVPATIPPQTVVTSLPEASPSIPAYNNEEMTTQLAPEPAIEAVVPQVAPEIPEKEVGELPQVFQSGQEIAPDDPPDPPPMPLVYEPLQHLTPPNPEDFFSYGGERPEEFEEDKLGQTNLDFFSRARTRVYTSVNSPRTFAAGLVVLVGLFGLTLFGISLGNGSSNRASFLTLLAPFSGRSQSATGDGEFRESAQPTEDVLAATSKRPNYFFTVSIPSLFKKNATFNSAVAIKSTLSVSKQSTLSGGIITNNADINAGTGTVTASNLVYSLTGGTGLQVTGGQNPVITNTGVTSLGGATGAVSLTAGSGIGVSGTTISNDGVLSLQGSTGALSLSAGSGISISGLTLTNSAPSQFTTDGTSIYYTGGNVGIGTTAPGQLFDVEGGAGIVAQFSGRVIGGNAVNANEFVTLSQVSGSLGSQYWQLNTGALSPADVSNDVLLGANSTASALIKFAGTAGGDSFFNTGGNVGIGLSSSLSDRLTVSGNLNVTGGYKINGVAGATVGTAACVTTSNGIVTGSGVCQLGSEQWIVNNGVLYPGISSLDVLFGGSASSSAKFAFLNNAAGTPTASISGNLSIGSPAGAGQTAFVNSLNGGSLSFGTSSGGDAGLSSRLLIANDGTLTASKYSTGIAHFNGSGVISSSAVNLASADVSGTLPVLNGGTGATTLNDLITLGTHTTGNYVATVGGNAQITVTGSGSENAAVGLSITGDSIGDSQLAFDTGQALTSASSPTFNALNLTSLIISGDTINDFQGTGLQVSGNVLSTTLGTSVDLTSEVTGILPVANGGTGTDLSSGGAIGDLLFADSATTFDRLAIGTPGQILTVNGSNLPEWVSTSSINYFQRANGAISPLAISDDFLLGGSSTNSARFAFTNASGPGSPTASISATTTGLSLSGSGRIQSLQNGTLTLGGDTTGNIILSALNGSGNVTITGLASGALYSNGGVIASETNLDVTRGGTGVGTFTQGGVLFGNGTSDLGVSTQGTAGQVLLSGGAATPTWTTGTLTLAQNFITAGTGAITLTSSGATNVTLPTGGTLATLAGNEALTNKTVNGLTLTEGASQFSITGGTGTPRTLTVTGNSSLNQDLLTTSSPTFNALNLTSLIISGDTINDFQGTGLQVSGNVLSTTLGTSVDLTSEVTGILPVANGGTGADLTAGGLNAQGSVPFFNGSGVMTTLAPGTGGYVLTTHGAGLDPTWTDATSLGTNFFQRSLGVVSPLNITDDITIGGSATASALIRLAGTTGQNSFFNTGGNLGIGTAASLNDRLTVSGDVSVSGVYKVGATSGITQGSPSCVTTTGGIVTGFGACQLGSEQWVVNNGAIYTGNPTLDLLLGGTSTDSARIALLNISGGSPTASLSAGLSGAAFLSADGSLQTTNKQSLTLGGGQTGNVVLSGFGAGVIHSNASGVLSSSSVVLTTDVTGILPVLNGGTGASSLNDLITLGTHTTGNYVATVGGNAQITVTGSGSENAAVGLSITGDSIGDSQLAFDTGQALTSASSPTFNALNLTSLIISGDTINDFAGTGLQVTGNTLSTTLGTDIDLASAEVTGILGVVHGGTGADLTAGGLNAQGSVPFFNGSGVMTTLAPGTGGYVLTTHGAGLDPTWTDATSLGTNYFQRANGAISPLAISDDFLLGGSSTTSARFAFTNASGPGSPTASISSNLSVIVPLGSNPATGINVLNGGKLSFGTSIGGDTGLQNRLTILNNGNIGIGTTTPGALFDVQGGAGIVAQFSGRVKGGNAVNPDEFATLSQVTGAVGAQQYLQRADGALSAINITDDFLLGGSATSSALIRLAGTANSDSFFNTGGNLGIGVTNPGYLLDVGSSGIVARFNGQVKGADAINNDEFVTLSQLNGVSGASQYFQRALGVVAPLQITNDLAVGGSATSSALFQVFGTTGSATTAGNLTFRGASTSINQLNGGAISFKTSPGGDAGLTSKLVIADDGTLTASKYAAGAAQFNSSGVLSSGILPVNLGGTGQISFGLNGVVIGDGSNPLGVTAAGTDGQVFIGRTSSTPIFATLSNDATISNTGVLTLKNTGPGAGSLGTTAAQTPVLTLDAQGRVVSVVNTNIAINGNQITSGVVGPTFGGTGFSSYAVGDLLYADTTTSLAKRLIGNTGDVLTVAGGVPTWAAASSINYFQRANGAISPLNITDDFLLGGSSSSSALFAFLNASGPGSPTASISSNLSLVVPIGANPATQLNILNGGNFNLQSSVGGPLALASRFFVEGNSGNIGIGNTSPLAHLDIKDTSSVGSLSSEVISNSNDRTFAASTGNWTGTNWSVSGGVGNHTPAGANDFTLANGALTATPASGNIYLVKFDVTTTTAGTLTPKIGGGFGTAVGQEVGTLTNQYQVITAINTNALTFTPNATWIGTIDNISVTQVTTSSIALRLTPSDGGTSTLDFRPGPNADGSIYIGKNSGQLSTGISVTAVGLNALASNYTGSFNNAFGSSALSKNTTGTSNNAFGYQTLNSNTTGSSNAAFGQQTLISNVIGSNNSAFGTDALSANKTGSNNVAFGYSSGSNITTGSNNVLIGYDVDAPSVTGSNQLSIGNLIFGTGVDGTGTTLSTGNIGIGVASPLAKLHVVGSLGTVPVSSISGNTSFAVSVIDQTGLGDIFTASKSGQPKFTILNNGNVNIYGTSTSPVTLTSAATSPRSIALPDATGTICLQSSSSCGFSIGTNYWQNANAGAISPFIDSTDVLVGGTATSSALIRLAGTANQNSFFNTGGSLGIGTTSPLAKLDIRGSNGTIPVASISGNTSQVALSVDNNGLGDLFTASKSGATKFTIANDGTLTASKYGAGAAQFNSNGVLSSGTLSVANGGTGVTTFGGTNTLLYTSSADTLASITAGTDGQILLGRTGNSPIFGTVSNDATISNTGVLTLKNTGPGAGSLGTTAAQTPVLTLDAQGRVVSVVNTNIAINGNQITSGVVGPTFGGTGFSSYAVGDLLYADTTTSLAKRIIGNTGDVLTVAGGVPTWAAASSINYFQRNNGAISPLAISDDFLLGGSSSSSARFAFINASGPGSPTASISSNLSLVVPTTPGVNQLNLLNGSNLTIQGSVGGDGGLSSALYINGSNGKVGFGTTSPTAQFEIAAANPRITLNAATGADGAISLTGGKFNIDQSGGFTSTTIDLSRGTFGIANTNPLYALTVSTPVGSVNGHALAVFDQTNSNSDIFTASASGVRKFTIGYSGSITASGAISGLTGISSSGNIDLSALSAGGIVKAAGGTGRLSIASAGSDYENPLTFGNGLTRSVNAVSLGGTLTGTTTIANGGFNLLLTGTGNVGIGTATPNATLDVLGNLGTGYVASVAGATSKSAFLVDNSGLGDLFTASKSGATKFTILNNGSLRLNNYTNNFGVLYTDGSGNVLQSAAGGSSTNCLKGDLTWSSCTAGGSVSYFQLAPLGGAISPIIDNYDVLVGSTATSSALIRLAGTSNQSSFFNGGNVGIGTTAPIGLLSVTGAKTGQALVQLNESGNQAIFTASASGTTRFMIGRNGVITGTGITSDHIAGVDGGGFDLSVIGGFYAGDATTGITINSNAVIAGNAPGVFGAGNIDLKLQAAGTGNVLLTGSAVGIGTTVPLAKLDVAGGASLSGSLAFRGASTTIDKLNGGALTFRTSPGGDAGLVNSFIIGSDGTLTAPKYAVDKGLLYTSGTGGSVAQLSPSAGTNCLKGDLTWGACTGGGSSTNFWQNANAGAISPFIDSTDVLVGGTATSSALIRLAGTVNQNSFFNTGGNLGVGTTAPLAKLDVRGSGGLVGQTTTKNLLTLTNTDAGATGNVVNLGFVANINGTAPVHVASISAFTTTSVPSDFGALAFSTYGSIGGNGGNGTYERMRIDGIGNVGIGTTSPIAKLHLSAGDLSGGVPSAALNQDALLIEKSDAVLGIYSDDLGTYGSGIALGGVSGGSLTSKWFIGRKVTTSGALLFNFGTNADYSTNNNLMALTTTGSLGIGTTTPLATLDVRGNLGTGNVASISGITSRAALLVDNSGFGDLFTASKSGATKFTILNSGNVKVAGGIGALNTDPNSNYALNATVTNGQRGLNVTGSTSTASDSFYGNYNTLSYTGGSGSPGIIAGTRNDLSLDAGVISSIYGTYNTLTAPGGNGSQKLYGTFNSFSTSTNSDTSYGLYNDFGATTLSGYSRYGVFNKADNSSDDTSSFYGVHNETDKVAFSKGVENNFTNVVGLGGSAYGIISTLSSGSNASSLYGVSNDITSAGVSSTAYGVKNTISGVANGISATYNNLTYNGTSAFGAIGSGTENILNLTNTGSINGTKTKIKTTAAGTAYGEYIDQDLASTNGTVYGIYLNLTDTDTTRFGIYEAGGVTNYFAGNVGLGTTSPLAALDVRGNSGTTHVASVSGNTSKAVLAIDNNGLGDLFTASKSGAMKFTILNSGNIQLGNYKTANGLLYTDGTGLLSQLNPSAGTNCLKGDLTWGACTGGGSSTNFWQNANAGAISPFIDGTDVLFGGTSSSSAKFAFLNNLTGSPTASIASNLSLVVPTGANPATQLNILNGGTFDLRRSAGGPNGTTSSLFVDRDGGVGIGTTTPGYKLDVVGGINATNTVTGAGTGISSTLTSTPTADQNPSQTVKGLYSFVQATGTKKSGDLFGSSVEVDKSGTSSLNEMNGYYSQMFTLDGAVASSSAYKAESFHEGGSLFTQSLFSGYGEADAGTVTNFVGIDIKNLFNGGATVTNRYGLRIGSFTGAATNDYGIYQVGGQKNYFASAVGIGTTSPVGLLHVDGKVTGKALVQINETGNQDLFTASASGATKFTIANNGNLTATGTLTGLTGLTLASGGINLGGTVGTGSQCLLGGATASWGSCGSGGTSYFQLSPTGGAISPIISNYDVLVGSTATSSALIRLAGTSGQNSFFNGGNVGIGTTNPVAKLDLAATFTNTSASTNYGNRLTVAATGNVSSGTDTTYGQYIDFTRSGASGGSINGFGQLITATASGTIDSLTGSSITVNSPAATGLDIVANTTADGNSSLLNGITATLRHQGSNLLNGATGLDIRVNNNGVSGISTATGISSFVDNAGGSNSYITDAFAFDAYIDNTSGTTMSNAYAFHGDIDNNHAVTNGYGLYLEDIGATNDFGIYQTGSNDDNYFAGNVGIGTSTPSSFKLQVAGNIGPNADITYDLGSSPSGRFRSLYLGPSSLHVQCTVGDGCGQGLDYALGVNTSTNNLRFLVNNNELLSLTQGGNLGIGVTNPGAFKLNVAGNSNITGNLTVTGGLTVGGATIANYFQLAAGAVAPNEITNDLLVGGSATASAKIRLAGTSGQSSFFNGGNVGIGTTSPNATLEILGNLGTSHVASISGRTSKASLVVDNDGLGDLFTASKSGATKFIVKNSGYVGINTGSPVAPLDIFDQTTTGASLVLRRTGGGNVGISFQQNGATAFGIVNLLGGGLAFLDNYQEVSTTTNERMRIDTVGNVGIGTSAPSTELHVSRPLSFGATGKALAIFDQLENQDIFTASAAGVPKFSITNTGNLISSGVLQANGTTAVGYNRFGTGTTSNGLSSANDLFVTGKFEVDGAMYVDGSIIVNATQGTVGWLQRNLGALSPTNITDDLLLGGSATASAKIRLAGTANQDSFFNTGGNLGIGTTSPLATIDVRGNLGTGNVASISGVTSRAALLVDNSGLGDLFTASKSGATKFVIANSGNVGIGTNIPTGLLNVASTANGLQSNGLGYFDWSPASSTTSTNDLFTLNVGSNGVLGNIFNIVDGGSSVFSVSQSQITAGLPVNFTAAGDTSFAYDLNLTNPIASYIKSAAPLYLQSGEIFNSSDLTLGTYNKGNIIADTEAFSVTGSASVSGRLTLGTTTAQATALGQLYVTNATTYGKALAILNSTESQDILAASASGTTRIRITSAGHILPGTDNTQDLGSSPSARFRSLYLGPGSVHVMCTVGDGCGQENDYAIGVNTTTGNMKYSINGTELMSLTQGGSLGIGTTAPGAFKLNVAGNSNFTGNITVNGALTVGGATVANYFQLANGAVAPNEITNDFLVGGSATASALIKLAGTSGQNSFFNTGGSLGVGTTSPLAKLDIRGSNGTIPVASVSGTTSYAALSVDNNGLGDLFTASKSGATKFVIANSGNVGIGTRAPTTGLLQLAGAASGTYIHLDPGAASNFADISSAASTGIRMYGGTSYNTGPAFQIWPTGSAFEGMYFDAGSGANAGISFRPSPASANTAMYIQQGTGNVGIGNSTSPKALLQVLGLASTTPTASISARSSFAGLVVDNTVGDLFTASSSGLNRFVITQAGNVGVGVTNPATRLDVAGGIFALDNGDFNAVRGLRFRNQADTTTPNGGGLYEASNNELYLQAGTANLLTIRSSSAVDKFRFDAGNGLFGINTTSPRASLSVATFNTTTPTASISAINGFAGLIVDNTTGDLFTASSSGLNRFVVKQNGSVGIGTSTPGTNLQVVGKTIIGASEATFTGTETLKISGGTNNDTWVNIAGSSNGVAVDDVRFVIGQFGNTGFIGSSTNTPFEFRTNNIGRFTLDTNGNLGLGPAALQSLPQATLHVFSSGNTPTARISATSGFAGLAVDNSVGDIFTASASGTNRFVIQNNGNVGIGTNAPIGLLNVQGATTGKAMAILNETGNQDIFTASKSGKTVFTVAGDSVKIGAQTNAVTALAQKNPSGTAGTLNTTTQIASISASVVYNGSLYVGTTKSNAAEVYRYDGGTTWTPVNTTAGTFSSGGTASIDGVSSMTVYNGVMYIGTNESTKAEVYKYNGGTGAGVFTQINTSATAGTLAGTASINAIPSMVVFGGKLIVGTSKNAAAQVMRYDGNLSWTALNTTAGTLNATATIDAIQSMAVYNNYLYVGTKKGAAAQVYRYNGTTGAGVFSISSGTGAWCTGAGTANSEIDALTVYDGKLYGASYGDAQSPAANAGDVCRFEDTMIGTSTTWSRVISAQGTIRSGGTANIDGIRSMTVYNGRLYIGTAESNSAQIYQYIDGDQWIVLNATAGTLASTANIDQVTTLISYNGTLYAGTGEPTSAEMYTYTNTTDQSYALKFRAASSVTSETVGGFNEGSIWFMASPSANMNNGGSTGSFMFSNSIVTATGAYDVAEDYPTRDDTLVPGDLVAIDENETGYVKKAGPKDQVMGVFSEKPGFRLSQIDDTIDGARTIPVALVGRVAVKVNTEHGDIKPGDAITTSSTTGVASKAVNAGIVIGRSMGGFSCDQIGPTASSSTTTNQVCSGKVMTYINVSYYDPSVYLMGDGNLTIARDEGERFKLQNASGELFKNKAAFADAAIANLSAGKIKAVDLDVSGKLTVGGKSLGEYMKQYGGSAVASYSAQLDPSDLASKSAVEDLKMKFDSLVNRISLLENQASISAMFADITSGSVLSASTSAVISGLDSMAANKTVDGDLTVLGRTVLSDLGVTGNITAGVLTMDGTDGAINSLGGPLKLQSNGVTGIDFFDGKVTFDTKGNMKTEGSITAKKINIDTTDTDSPSLGQVLIKAGQTSVQVTTGALTTKSRIFVTPDQPVAAGAKPLDADTFTITLDKPAVRDVKVSWWVIN